VLVRVHAHPLLGGALQAHVQVLQDDQPGRRADVNVINLAELRSLQPQIVNDFPGGAPRYIQRARGYRATIVNGGVNIEDDRHTGERAGQVLRRVH
jgi:N-acyl-D-aspartate/D-glutamate deacylase